MNVLLEDTCNELCQGKRDICQRNTSQIDLTDLAYTLYNVVCHILLILSYMEINILQYY